MKLTIEMIGVAATKALLDRAERQLPFAAALALNRTAEEAVDAQRAGMRRRFTIRREWVLRQVRIVARADKNREPIEAVVEITPTARFLRIHESGGQRVGDIRGPIAIPTSALRPAPAATIPQRLYPVQLGFRLRKAISPDMPASTRPEYMALVGTGYEPGSANIRHTLHANARIPREGPFRTFELDPRRNPKVSARQAGIYQRVSATDVRLIWAYRDRITVRPRLGFGATVTDTVTTRLGPNFEGMLEHALATAR